MTGLTGSNPITSFADHPGMIASSQERNFRALDNMQLRSQPFPPRCYARDSHFQRAYCLRTSVCRISSFRSVEIFQSHVTCLSYEEQSQHSSGSVDRVSERQIVPVMKNVLTDQSC
jgi:hypothetical protein